MRMRIVAATLVGLALGFGLSFGQKPSSESSGTFFSVSVGFDEAWARNPTEELVDVVDDSHVLLLRFQGFRWAGYQALRPPNKTMSF